MLIYYFTNFLRFTMNFQSSCKIITNQSLRHYSHESQVLQKGPSLMSNFNTRSLTQITVGRSSESLRFRPEEARRRRWGGGGAPGGLVRTRRWPHLAQRRPDAAWPRTPAAWATATGGTSATGCGMADGEVREGRRGERKMMV